MKSMKSNFWKSS